MVPARRLGVAAFQLTLGAMNHAASAVGWLPTVGREQDSARVTQRRQPECRQGAMAYPTLAYRCGLLIRRQHDGTTPLAGTARDNQPTRSSPWNTSASECRPRRLHLSISQRRRITGKDTGKWAKYPIELLQRAYVTKSPDAPRLVSTPRAHRPYPGKAHWARPDRSPP